MLDQDAGVCSMGRQCIAFRAAVEDVSSLLIMTFAMGWNAAMPSEVHAEASMSWWIRLKRLTAALDIDLRTGAERGIGCQSKCYALLPPSHGVSLQSGT